MAVGERCAGVIHDSSRVGEHVTAPLSPCGFRIASTAWSRCLRGSGEELHRRRLRRHTSGSRPAGPALRRSLPRVVYSTASLTMRGANSESAKWLPHRRLSAFRQATVILRPNEELTQRLNSEPANRAVAAGSSVFSCGSHTHRPGKAVWLRLQKGAQGAP